MKINPQERICIIRSAFLGDWISTIPFLIYLIEFCHIPYENIHIIVINNKGLNPVEKIHGPHSLLKKNTQIINSSNFKTILRSALQIRKRNKYKVDRIIYLPFTNESWINVLKKYLISFLIAPLNIKRNGFKYYERFPAISNSQYFSYFSKLGIDFKLKKTSVRSFLNFESIITNEGLIKKKKQIAIYASSKLEMKIWPIDNYTKVINEIANKFDADFFLIGASEDFVYNELLLNNISKQINVVNLAGKLDIPSSISFLSNIDLLISNDGAPIHMAALVDISIVGLYTSKEPPGTWDPVLSSNYIVIRTDVMCKNCFKENCINPICLHYISPSVVINACEDLLNGKISNGENKILFPPFSISYKSNVI